MGRVGFSTSLSLEMSFTIEHSNERHDVNIVQDIVRNIREVED